MDNVDLSISSIPTLVWRLLATRREERGGKRSLGRRDDSQSSQEKERGKKMKMSFGSPTNK
jgi:hypothetical protein